MSKIIKSWSVLLKVINAHWDSHGRVGSAFGGCLLVPCVSGAFAAVQIIFRVLLHIVVDVHVLLPDFGGSSSCIVVTLFVYLIVVVSTTQRLLVVPTVRILDACAAWSLRSLVVAAVQRIHY